MAKFMCRPFSTEIFYRLRSGCPHLNSSLIHTSVPRRDIMEFFEKQDNWNDTDILTGRSWQADDLRKKSNTDLHKLWYVLLKERNMLLTMQRACKQNEPEERLFPNPERIDKVEESMTALEEVVHERNSAVLSLETGQTGDRPTKTLTSILGFRVKETLDEHILPRHMVKLPAERRLKRRRPTRRPYYDHSELGGEYETPILNYDQFNFMKMWKERLRKEARNEEDDRKRLNDEHKYWYKY